MKMIEFTTYSEKERQAVKEQLDEESSFLMKIIRGHFLIEQKLNEMLLILARNPKVIQASNAPRVEFVTKMYFIKAIAPEPPYEWFWPAISKINSIRNKAAHGLESEKLDEAIKDFVDHMKNNDPIFKKNINNVASNNIEDQCIYAITSVFSFHTLYVHKIKEFLNKA